VSIAIHHRRPTIRPAPKRPRPTVGFMNAQPSSVLPAAPPAGHVTITPAILYFGTPVVLLSTENENGSFNLAPMSSAWALDQVIVLGLGPTGRLVDGSQHIDPARWSPLVYNFRHYYGLGPELGHSFRSQTPRTP
jgi:flavin reductase (DIM6/NTAB) family NADH-FMN oxidoreductase RutF